MCKVGIIADDLTGSNATGVLLSKKGFKTVTLLDTQTAYDSVSSQEAVCISTDSRSINSTEAYKRVVSAFGVLKSLGCNLICKRIDSTLRGNIGREIDAVLDCAGDSYKAVVVPSYPLSGRICIGGHVLVNSIPLDETSAAKDPKTPVYYSKVEDIIKLQSTRKIQYIPFEVVKSSESLLTEAINKIPSGTIAVIDAVTDKDIEKIARCCVASKDHIIPVDPGPFSAAMAAQLYSQITARPNILMVTGSTTELTRKQIRYLNNTYKTKWIKVDVRSLLVSPENEIKRVSRETVLAFEYSPLIGIATVLDDHDLLSAEHFGEINTDDFYNKINAALGRIVFEVLSQKPDISALYVTGGDTTKAVLESLGAWGINIKGEVIPLAVFGTLAGGEFATLPIVTKGGLIGTDETLKLCIDYIYNKIS